MKSRLPLSLFFLLTLVTNSGAAQTPKTAPARKQDQCKIAGMVVKFGGSEPLRKAKVRLANADDGDHTVSIVTDGGGHFELKGIDPGRYHLTVSRAGFVTQEYGQKKPDDVGAMLTLRPGQEMKDLLFRLIPSGVIAGRILDEDGEPLAEVMVSALRQVYLEGKRSLSTDTSAQTNDLGEYRLFGLAPGRYFITANFSRWGRFSRGEEADDASASQEGYAKMYYPGTPDSAKAISVTVKPGDEIPSVDILMRQVPVYRVRGHVYNQVTHKPGTGTNLMLMPKAKSREWDFSGKETNVQKKDGSFEIVEVLPGSYFLIAFWFDEGKPYSTRMPIDVGNADIEGLSVIIAPGVNINGRVIWDGPPSLEGDELTVGATPTDFAFAFNEPSRVSQTGSFTLKDLGEGIYHANVAGESKNCYIKEIRYGGSSAFEDGFMVTKGTPAELEIVISSRGARVQGTITDEDGLPAAGVWVVLIPEASRRSQSRLYKTANTDQYGHYDLRGIAPGEYKIFSWERVETGAWEDAEFLKPFEVKGETISVQEGAEKAINLTAIRTKSPDSAKQ